MGVSWSDHFYISVGNTTGNGDSEKHMVIALAISVFRKQLAILSLSRPMLLYIVRKGTLCRWINRYIVKQSRQHMQYMQSTSEFVASFLLIYSSVVQNNQKSKCKYWGTRLSVCSFAHTAHLFTCSALLTSLRSLVCFLAPSLTPKLVGK